MGHVDDTDAAQKTNEFQEVLGRGRREKRSARMAELIANERLGSDDSGNESISQSPKPAVKRRKGTNGRALPNTVLATANSFDCLSVEEASDADDNNYEVKESSSSASSTDLEEITNEEVCEFCFSHNIKLLILTAILACR